MHRGFRFLMVGFLFVAVGGGAFAQNVPELMYYKFDESGGPATQNFANPGVGLNPAPLTGQTMGGTGQFGSALIGTGVANNFVNTGWTTALGTGSWTISMWLNNLPSNTSLFYLWGDNTASSFRSFLGGAAGAGNVTLRVTGLSDCIVTGVAPGPTVVTYVYDASANRVRGYKNGVLAVTATPTSALNINGTGATTFRVGAYGSSTGLPAGGLMDEFRMYNRALDSAEIAATWNQQLPLGTPGWTSQTSGITTALYSVKAVSPSIVWVAGAGGVVLRTTNGGTTWTSVGGGNIGTADIYNIFANSATSALVTTTPSTTSYIFRTTNGGTTWDTVFSQAGGFINAIHMFDANNGIAQGDPVGGRWTVIRTTNGGASWVRDTVNAPLQVGSEFGANNGMKVIGTNSIWWTPGTGNGFYRTTDGGTTWNRSTLPASGFTSGIDFIDTQVGVVGNSAGAAARTTDGGATWSPVTIGTSGAIYSVGAAGTLEFWATRGTTIQTSKNRGVSWTQDFSDASAGTFEHSSFIVSGSTVKGWAVTSTGKIYTYFNPVALHDLGVTSLGAAPTTRPNSQPSNAVNDSDQPSADYATGAPAGADEGLDQSTGISITPLDVFTLADTMRFRAIVKNFGTFTEPSYGIGWQIDGVAQTPVNRGSIGPGALDTVILQWNNATVGAHTVRAWTILAEDGNRANDTATASFTFSLDRGVWTSLPPSPNALSRSCVAYIRINDTGYVYQFGGGSGTQLNSVARFNTVTNTWTNTGFAPIPFAVSAGTAITVGDSNIILFGGENAANTLGKTQMYNVYTNTWTPLADMIRAVTDAAVVKWRNSHVYVIGGGNGLFGTFVTDTVQVYNLQTNTYSLATFYPVKAAMMGAGIFNDTIIVAGGWSGTTGVPNAYKGIVNPANPTQITWTPIAQYPVGGVTRMAATKVSRGGGAGVLCAGGAINGATLTAKAYLWNFCTGNWSPLDTFAVPRSNMKAAGDGGPEAYVIGGFTTVGVGTSDKFTLLNLGGTCVPTGVSEADRTVPQSFELSQNYPNPFNPTTTIKYGLPAPATVSLKIYNVLGQEVARVFEGEQPAGYHEAVWDGRALSGSPSASGVFFYRLEAQPTNGAPAFIGIKKMVLVK